MKKAFLLTTGLLFKTENHVSFTEKGDCYDGDKDSNFGLSGSILISIGKGMYRTVTNFRFNSSNIIASWDDYC